MKSVILTGVVSFFILFPGYPSSEALLRKLEPAPSIKAGSFPPGEISKYSIIYLFARVGRGEIEYIGTDVLDGIPVHHVRSSFSRLGAIDSEDIYGTTADFLPLLVKRRISGLSGSRVVTEKYDQENYRIEIDMKKGDTVEREIISSDDRIQNLILLFFYLRQQELEEGKKIPVSLPKQEFLLEVKGLAELDVPYGTFTAYELSSDNGDLRVWISADDNPVLLKAMLDNSLFGRYSLVMTGFGNQSI